MAEFEIDMKIREIVRCELKETNECKELPEEATHIIRVKDVNMTLDENSMLYKKSRPKAACSYCLGLWLENWVNGGSDNETVQIRKFRRKRANEAS